MDKKYKIINNFTDIETNEKYTPEHESVEFSEKRVEEINLKSKLLGYELIEEVKPIILERPEISNKVEIKQEVVKEEKQPIKMSNLDKLKNKVNKK